MKRLYLLLLLLLGNACFCLAVQKYRFERIEVSDGLSNNQITAIYKDSRGFMWFGTAAGLNRYDGYEVKVYQSRQNDETSLPNSYIETIQEDEAGCLWIRTGNGYCVYDPATDSFDRDMEARMKKMGVNGNPARIYMDEKGSTWIFVYGIGIYRRKPGAEKADRMEGSVELMTENDICDMQLCSQGMIMSRIDGSFFCIDEHTLEVKWMEREICDLGQTDRYALFLDRSGVLWIHGIVGTWKYNLEENRMMMRSPRSAGEDAIYAIAQDKNGNLWLGYDQQGVEVVDTAGNKAQLFDNTTANNHTTVIYEDDNGTIWIGSYKQGIFYYNESIFKFALSHLGDINCVLDDGNDTFWVGTNGDGLLHCDMKSGDVRRFHHTASERSLSGNVVVCMMKDSKGRLWVGSYYGGLNCLENGGFTHYRANPDAGGLVNDNVWALLEDKKGNIWIGTLGGGIQCFNPATGQFVTYNESNSGLSSNYISSLVMMDDKRMAVSTAYGLCFLDLETHEIRRFEKAGKGCEALYDQNINQVYTDSRGWLWIATREGMNVYDVASDALYAVELDRDYPNQMMLGVTEDGNHNMWVTYSNKLLNILVTENRPGGGEPAFRCYAYDYNDGLHKCDFNQRSIITLESGSIVAGGLYGLNYFDPQQIKYNRMMPRVMFTNMLLFDETIKVGKEYGGRVILPKDLNSLEKVELDYTQNVFTIQFATDNLILPQKTRYSYKLEGFTDTWLDVPAGMHHVTYTNLAPGAYRLYVTATNSDGYQSTETTWLKIVIRPPFWMTTWAYVCYVVLLLAFIGLLFYLFHRRERSKFRLRQMEEDARKNEELNQLKFRFFTNVSHELRTPLTLIISPLESMISEIHDERQKNKLQLMHRNAQRLLNLVNQLLDFRKNEMTGMKLSLSEGDIVAYVRNICTSFLMLSEKKRVHLTFFSAMEALNMPFDEDKVGKVVMNLLSNAFKFTPEGGRVDVAMETPKERPDRLVIRVADTGIGIKDADKERVFDRFYQVTQEESGLQSTGSGIGLSLVRDFVALHGGTVCVVDNAGGKGSVFVVELPVKLMLGVDSETPGTASAAMPEELQPEEEMLPEEEMDELPEEDEETGQTGGREKPLALLVDDNEDLIAFMRDSLGLYFRIRSASNGREAWQLIPNLMPDIIVSDVMMPEMDGNELCRWVKTDKRTCDIPLILLTAKQEVADKVEGLSIGADDYMTKPFNVEILVLRMQKLIALSRRKQVRTYIDPEPSEIAITSMDEKLIENAIRYVEENIARSDLSVEELSQELGMSRVHLYKKLSQITGKSPIEFIRVIRLKRAAQLLRESQLNVSEIAYRVGFNNPKYFSKYFKDEFGMLPSTYQEREGK